MNTHPGFAALQRIIAKAYPPTDGALALMYLEDRIAKLEAAQAERSARFVPPSPKEVEEYGNAIKFAVDGQAFCAFYEARGWMMGKSKMKSWKAAVRTWKSRRDSQPQPKPTILPDNLRDHHGL